MKHIIDAVTRQIEIDVREACDFGPGDSFQVGPRTTVHDEYPQGTCVMAPLAREFGGARSVDLDLEFDILVELPKRLASEETAFAVKLEYAERLIQKLAPFDYSDVPAANTIYAGAANQRRVSLFDPMHDMDHDGGWVFAVKFHCSAVVYQ